MWWSLLFKKVADLQAGNFVKKRLLHRFFPVGIAKFLKTPILKNKPVLPKAAHVCSDHFTEDSSDESQELKRHLLSSNLKYILKTGAVPFLTLISQDQVLFICAFTASFQ